MRGVTGLDPASETFSVAGGIAGHVAMTEDLHAATRAIVEAAALVSDATGQARRAQSELMWSGATRAGLPVELGLDWRVARAETALASILSGATGTLRAEDALLDIADRLGVTVASMEQAENAAHRGLSLVAHVKEGVADRMGLATSPARGLAWLAWRISAPGVFAGIRGADPVGEALQPGIPETTGIINRDVLEAGPDIPAPLYKAAAFILAAHLAMLEFRIGEPRPIAVTPRRDVKDVAAPESIADLLRGVHATEEVGGGAVTVQRVEGADGERYIVSIPGTGDWSLSGDSTADAQANPATMAGMPSDAMAVVASAMAAAGIPADAEVMLAGHSQGGILAMALTSNASFMQRYRVTHVVTSGAPVAHFAPPPQVKSLHLEHHEDIVPGLDTRKNGNAANQTTFSHALSQSPSAELSGLSKNFIGAHSLHGYIATAELATSGVSVSVDAFTASAAPFLDAGAQTTTTVYAPVVAPLHVAMNGKT